MTGLTSTCLAAAIEYRDALDLAVMPPEEVEGVERTDRLIFLVGDGITYDNNIYLLPRQCHRPDHAARNRLQPQPQRLY